MQDQGHVSVYARTDVGRRRESNEDQFAVQEESGEHTTALPAVRRFANNMPLLCMVSDGMGGALAGEVASLMAVQTIGKEKLEAVASGSIEDKKGFLEKALQAANHRIYVDASTHEDHRGMGATATVALLEDHTCFFGQVGDSRAYVLRNGALHQITNDQTAVEFFVRSGLISPAEAINHPRGNIVLQALGTEASVNPEISKLELRRDDVLLLCSDGLSGLVSNMDIQDILLNHTDLAAATDALVAAANEQGGLDNITVVLLKCEGPGFALPDVAPPHVAMLRAFEMPNFRDQEEAPTAENASPTSEGLTQKYASLRYGILAVMIALIGYAAWRWIL